MQVLTYLRAFNLPSVALRLFLAVLSGRVLGYGRSQKQRAAGMRTYTLICLGAALSVIVSLFEYEMLMGPWYETVLRVGEKFDVSRHRLLRGAVMNRPVPVLIIPGTARYPYETWIIQR